jgi:hypothetical protein
MHGLGFPNKPSREHFRWADLVHELSEDSSAASRSKLNKRHKQDQAVRAIVHFANRASRANNIIHNKRKLGRTVPQKRSNGVAMFPHRM